MDLDWKPNLGTTDRVVRAALGVALLVLAVAHAVTPTWSIVAAVFGLAMLVEAAFAY